MPLDPIGPPDLSISAANRYFMLRPARITRVDPERWFVDIEWLDGPGGASNIQLTNPYDGPRSFMGVMPEENSLCLCHFFRHSQRSARPSIVAYLPTSWKSGFNYDSIDGGVGRPEVRRKKRKIYPGEGWFASKQGSEVLLSRDVYISNSKLNEFEIRSADQSIRQNSISNYLLTNAGRISNGPVIRNDVLTTEFLPTTFPSISSLIAAIQDAPGINPATQKIGNITPIVLPNGKRLWVVTTSLSLQNPDLGGTAWNEYRFELTETSELVPPILEENADLDVDSPYASIRSDQSTSSTLKDNLLFVQVVGTLVGYNPLLLASSVGGTSGIQGTDYGKVLKRQIFGTHASTTPTLRYLAAITADEENKLASLFHLLFPKTRRSGKAMHPTAGLMDEGTTFDINKEGKVSFVISPSSTSDPLGEGRSVEGAILGGTKLYLGRQTNTPTGEQKESLRFDTAGKIKGTVGRDEGVLGESINITTQGGINVTIQQPVTAGPDSGKSLKITVQSGNVELNNTGPGTIEVKTPQNNIKMDGTTGQLDIKSPSGNVNIEATAQNVNIRTVGGQVQLQGPTLPLAGVVTQKHVCAFTGMPHPQGSSNVLAT